MQELACSSSFPAGSLLAYHRRDPMTRGDIWVLPVDGEHEPEPSLQTPANESGSVFSPLDGKCLAHQSDESGRYEVYVQPLPCRGKRTVVSTEGGSAPGWVPDGSELLFDRAIA